MKVPGGANTQKAAVQAWKIGPNQLWGEVALLSLLLMDFSPLALWFSILSRAQSPQPFGESFLIFFFCTYVGVWFARGLTLLRFPKSFQLPARWLLGIVIVWFCQTAILYPGKWVPIEDYWLIPSSILQQTRIVPTAFWVAIFSLICVFRSFHLASGNITRWDILTSFFTGAFLLTSYGLLLPREQMTESAVAGTIFITFALIAAGCGRITTLAVSKGGSKTRFTPQWLLAIIVSAICVVGVGLALSLGISKISGLFSVLIWLLFLLWVILISGPLMLVGWVIIRLNIQPDNPISVGIMTVLGAFQDFIHLFQTRIRLSLSSSRMSLVGIVLLVVGVSALFILSRLWRRKNRPPEDVDEEDEKIGRAHV
jgi:hypothetical protein